MLSIDEVKALALGSSPVESLKQAGDEAIDEMIPLLAMLPPDAKDKLSRMIVTYGSIQSMFGGSVALRRMGAHR